MELESLSERGLMDVVDGSVFRRLEIEIGSGSTSNRLIKGRFGGGSIVGRG